MNKNHKLKANKLGEIIFKKWSLSFKFLLSGWTEAPCSKTRISFGIKTISVSTLDITGLNEQLYSNIWALLTYYVTYDNSKNERFLEDKKEPFLFIFVSLESSPINNKD